MAIGRTILLFTVILVCRIGIQAQTNLNVSDLGNPSLISPYYFGPNAFPIPDLLEGTTSQELRVEFGSDYFHGTQKDKTYDVYLKLAIPVFSERVNLSIWMPVIEWWNNSPERQHTCRLDPSKKSGRESGDVYVSTDIWLLQSKRFKVDVSVRAAMKTASGNGFATGRYYDSPAYFFDASVSKPILFRNYVKELRISGSSGFLCWQTDNGRQNDAVMYGIALSLRTKHFTLRESFGGYIGWESFAAHDKSIKTGDCPMSLKSDLIFHYKAFDFSLRHQVGLNDWPFHQFRLGITYKIAILK